MARLKTLMAMITTIGDKSNDIPPVPIEGRTRRNGPSTGSVMAYRKLKIDAIGELGEMGNQLEMIRTNIRIK